MRDLTIKEQIDTLVAHIKLAEMVADSAEKMGYKDNAKAVRGSLISVRRTLARLERANPQAHQLSDGSSW